MMKTRSREKNHKNMQYAEAAVISAVQDSNKVSSTGGKKARKMITKVTDRNNETN